MKTGPLPRRVSIVGPSGSGKTTLAYDMAKPLGLAVHELDRLRDMTIADAAADTAFLASADRVSSGDSWVIDGHYRCARDLVWRRADTIVWLNYPLTLVLRNLVHRYRAKGQAQRDGDVPRVAGAGWRRRAMRIVKTLRERSDYRRHLSAPSLAHVRLVELRSPDEARRWIETLAAPDLS